MFKKSLALLLAVCMILTIVPFSVMADDTVVDGVETESAVKGEVAENTDAAEGETDENGLPDATVTVLDPYHRPLAI